MGLCPSHIVVRTLILRFSYLVFENYPSGVFSRLSTNFSIQIPICFPARSKWVSAHPTYSPHTTPPLLPTYPFIPLLWSPPNSPLRLPLFLSPFFSSPLPPPLLFFLFPSLYPFLILPSPPLPFFLFSFPFTPSPLPLSL